MPGYSVESSVIKHPVDVEQDWLDLQNKVDCSYFQSWGWIGSWLENIAIDYHPLVVRVRLEDTLVGIGIFMHKHISRHLIVHSDAFFLNEYPFDGRNMVIEYNGVLADSADLQHIYKEIIQHLFQSSHKCNELFFSAVQLTSPLIQATEKIKGVKTASYDESSAWSIDLGGFQYGINAYLATLSKNRRAQIRRSIRLYEEHGPLQIVEAASLGEAQAYMDGLKELHTARWRSKGLKGAFANPLWESFHRKLIRSRFAKGEIQLLKVHVSNQDIGYLYNLVWRKRVYVMQSGFKLSDDKRLMPGYVVHALAIAHNKIKGINNYDLMHGYSIYKSILCDQHQTLYWMVVQRRQLNFFLEDMARYIVRKFRRL